MNKAVRYIGQAMLYGAFIATVGYFSTAPAYVQRGPNESVLKISVSHAGQVKQPCRRRSDDELAQLAPNMRTPLDCPRERSPVEITLDVNEVTLYRAVLAPTGLAADGVSSVYRRFTVPSGSLHLRAQLKDHVELTDFNYVKEDRLDLKPGQVVVIDFNARRGGFDFR